MSYVINVGRMQLVNKYAFVAVPLIIMGSALALVILIGAILVPGSSPFYTGAGQAPLWYFFASGIQALVLTFPFSQGLSISRRNYFFGTTVTFALVALGFSLLFFLLGLVEKVTDGWWVHGYVFALPWVTSGPWYSTILFIWLLTVLLFMMGFFGATLYKRFRLTGLMIASLAVTLVLIAVAGVFTLTHNWGAFARFAAAQTTLSVSGPVAIVILVMAAASYLAIRRATP
ncbi:MAG TPA: hypothetical protein VIP98_22295 [Microlunatus sp.]